MATKVVDRSKNVKKGKPSNSILGYEQSCIAQARASMEAFAKSKPKPGEDKQTRELRLHFQKCLQNEEARKAEDAKEMEGCPLDLSLLTDLYARQQARKAYACADGAMFGDAGRSGHAGLALVRANEHLLKAEGMYEAAIVAAFCGCKYNNLEWSIRQLRRMLDGTDRSKLMAAGDRLPGSGPFTVYRGVAGTGCDRRPRGLSWTLDRNTACWFALWPSSRGVSLHDPAVYTATVAADEVCFYSNDRNEQEIVAYPKSIRRVDLSPEQLAEGRGRHTAAEQARETRRREAAVRSYVACLKPKTSRKTCKKSA